MSQLFENVEFKRVGFGIRTTSLGLAVWQFVPGVALAVDAAGNSLFLENSDSDNLVWANDPVNAERVNAASTIAAYTVLPVPEANLAPGFALTGLPAPPAQRPALCTANCSDTDLFVFQPSNPVPPRQVAPLLADSNGAYGLTNTAFSARNETFLQQVMATYGGTGQPSAPQAPAFSQASRTPVSPYQQSPSLFPQASNASGVNNLTASTPRLFPQSANASSVNSLVPPEPRLFPQTTVNPSSANGLARPTLNLQGVSLVGDGEFSGRARLTATYPINQNLLIGGSVETVTGNAFVDSQQEGVRLNELYLAASLPSVPNLRLVAGQLDLSSYFDRNSFAKDGATQFFNSAFQSNPSIISSLNNSNPGALLNWSVNDNLELRAAAFSSDRDIGDFSLDGYAGEIAYRFGNAIIRGTYVSARDGGAGTGFQESYLINRGNGQTGILPDDREVSYGINGEIFFPELNLGLFGRYGFYENQTLDLSGDTFSLGLAAFDLLSENDRLGIAYGQMVSNDALRQQAGLGSPDVVEVFYDFEPFPNLRLGASLQQINSFSDTVFEFRVGYDTDFGSFR